MIRYYVACATNPRVSRHSLPPDFSVEVGAVSEPVILCGDIEHLSANFVLGRRTLGVTTNPARFLAIVLSP